MLDNLMTNVVDVSRPVITKGTSGAQKNVLSSLYSDLPCSLQPAKGSWVLQYQARHINITHSLYFNSIPDIDTGDVITFGTRTFLVQGFRDLITLGRVFVVDVLETQ